jgi:hypothetical protein
MGGQRRHQRLGTNLTSAGHRRGRAATAAIARTGTLVLGTGEAFEPDGGRPDERACGA